MVTEPAPPYCCISGSSSFFVPVFMIDRTPQLYPFRCKQEFIIHGGLTRVPGWTLTLKRQPMKPHPLQRAYASPVKVTVPSFSLHQEAVPSCHRFTAASASSVPAQPGCLTLFLLPDAPALHVNSLGASCSYQFPISSHDEWPQILFSRLCPTRNSSQQWRPKRQ